MKTFKNKKEKFHYAERIHSRSGASQPGFTNFEMSVLLGLFSGFVICGLIFFHITSKSAYDITAKHDLIAFQEFQRFYYKLNGKCIGTTGQVIRNKPESSDIVFEDYSVSENIIISIISGNPETPYDEHNPYIFQCRHIKSDKVFEMNFATGKISER
jgi:hypothetical protein